MCYQFTFEEISSDIVYNYTYIGDRQITGPSSHNTNTNTSSHSGNKLSKKHSSHLLHNASGTHTSSSNTHNAQSGSGLQQTNNIITTHSRKLSSRHSSNNNTGRTSPTEFVS